MRPLLLVLLIFQLCGSSYSQPADSAPHSIDSHNRVIQTVEDSLYRQRMLRNMAEKGQTIDRFLADFKERQEKERRQTYIKVGVGAIFMAALIYGLLRKRKLQQKP